MKFERDVKEIRRLLEADKEPIDERGTIVVAKCKKYRTGCGSCDICGREVYLI
jgi:hypothetical protein